MVDVSGKAVTDRTAIAECVVGLGSATADALFGGSLPKGDALASIRLAGIMGAKRTPDLVPLCHPILLSGVTVDVERSGEGARITAQVTTSGPATIVQFANPYVSFALGVSHMSETSAGSLAGTDAGAGARDAFDRVHRERTVPEEIETCVLEADADGTLWIGHALTRSGLAQSTSEARRLLKQRGVRIDGAVVEDPECHVSQGSYVMQRGKRRFLRLLVDAAGEPDNCPSTTDGDTGSG